MILDRNRTLNFKSRTLFFAILAGVFVLHGCGGGGGDNNNAEDETEAEILEEGGNIIGDGESSDDSTGDDGTSDDSAGDDGTSDDGTSDENSDNDETGNDSGGNADGTGEITKSELQALISSGTWVYTSKMSFSHTIDEPVSHTVDSEGMSSDIETVIVDGNSVTTQACGELAPKTRLLDEFLEFENELKNEDSPQCSEQGFSYFQETSGVFIAALSCNGKPYVEWEVKKVSDATNFNHGTFSFVSNNELDASPKSGICGEYSNNKINLGGYTTSEETVPDREFQFVNMAVSAPYGDARVLLTMSFKKDVAPGTYTANPFVIAGSDENNVVVNIASFTFGSIGADPVMYTALSGTVTIDSVSLAGATGSFDFMTVSGTTFKGDFSYQF
jgi:hypothetical protein